MLQRGEWIEKPKKEEEVYDGLFQRKKENECGGILFLKKRRKFRVMEGKSGGEE